MLRALDPEGAYLDGSPGLGWPVDESMQEGLYPGLPYFIVDARPQGFLGRSFARQQGARLGLPTDPERWSDDDVLVTLALAGEDLPGDLIVGEMSLETFQRRRAAGASAWPAGARAHAYEEQAIVALRGEAPGSSAGGEFPKFTGAILEPFGRFARRVSAAWDWRQSGSAETPCERSATSLARLSLKDVSRKA